MFHVDGIATATLLILIGYLAGSGINYLADVLPVYRRPVQPFCLECHAPQPVRAFLFSLFRYSSCGHSRPIRVLFVLLIGIACAFWMWLLPPARLNPILGYLLLVYFGLVIVIDVEHKLILHPVSLAGVVICGGIGWLRHGLLSTLVGGAAGFGIMLGLYLLGELFIRGLRKRRGETVDEIALGFGDVNLAGVIGLLLGWPGIVPGLILAILLGGFGSLLYLIWMWVRGRYRVMAAIPYGPFIALSAIILFFR
jgi:leader peptidase (prepilin peptidase)/N-methyltransferase